MLDQFFRLIQHWFKTGQIFENLSRFKEKIYSFTKRAV